MYLIIGANGFLGSYIIKNILKRTQENIVATSRCMEYCTDTNRIQWFKCEITNDNDIHSLLYEIQKKKKKIGDNELNVIYLSAYHKPDQVEENPRLAWEINVIALAKILNKLENIRSFFYTSTDSVYGASSNMYHFKEEDRLNPQNVYGKQKMVAESLVLGYGYNVVRYPFLIGPSLLQYKKHFYDVIVENIKAGNIFDMFEDSYRSSITFDMAAAMLIQLIRKYKENLPKVLNISGDEELSKYDVGIRIANKEGISPALIRAISIRDGKKIFSAPRADSTLLDNEKIKSILGINEIKLMF